MVSRALFCHLESSILSRVSYRSILVAGGIVLAASSMAVVMRPIGKPLLPILGQSRVTSAVPSSQVINFAVSLRPKAAEDLQAFADAVSDPRSPSYRHFILPAEVGIRFGASSSDQAAVVTYLKSKGLKIVLSAPNRMGLLVQGTASQVQSAFGTTLKQLSGKDPLGKTISFRANTTPFMVPSNLVGVVADVSGVENYTRAFPRATSLLTPDLTRALYNTKPAYNNGFHGEGRTQAISNFDGYRLSNIPLYVSSYNLPIPPGGVGSNIQVINVGTPSGPGTPQGEGDLDIQMELGMAPLATLQIYDGSDLVSVLTKEVSDNTADVISESYGWNLDTQTVTSAHNQHLAMTAQGMTYMEATGDFGTTIEPFSYSNYEPEVLQVGGTIASVDNVTGARITEVGWSGSGGGWSTKAVPFNKLPPWQVGNGVPTGINFRLNPDISLHAAGPQGAYFFVFNGVLGGGSDGTSFSSPVCAGNFIILEQRLEAAGLTARLGRVSDAIYAMNGRPDVWLDILSGANGTLPNGQQGVCTPGWDFVTGWGAPDYDGMFNVLSGPTNPPTLVAPDDPVVSAIGTYVDGTNLSLIDSDDNLFLVNSSFFGHFGSAAGVDLTFTLPGTPTSLAVQFDASAGRVGGAIMVWAWNWNTSTYDLVGDAAMSGSQGFVQVIRIRKDLANYVDGSNHVQLRFRGHFPVRPFGALPGPFTFSLDQLELQVQT